MKKRYLYLILFGVPGLIIALIASFLLSGLALGVLWLFVFGDSPWPAYAETILAVFFVFTFLTAWAATLVLGFVIGKRLEKTTALNWNHIWVSTGITVLLVLFILVQQLSLGNLGPKSEAERCMDFCVQEGYSASSTYSEDATQRTCRCVDKSGEEGLTIPLDDLQP